MIVFSTSFRQLRIDLSGMENSLNQTFFTLKQFINIDWSVIDIVVQGMITSLSIAIVAVILSTVVSIPISLLAANNLAINSYLSSFIKGFVALLRSVPTLVWGLMIIASIGFGNEGGLLTLVFVLSFFQIRAFTGSIEEVGMNNIEALRSTGATWPVIAIKGVLPMAIPSIIAWIAISFEIAVGTSISLGMIGVGGIGKVIVSALGQYKYGQVTVGILVIFLTMYIIEISTIRLKSSVKKGK